VVETSLTGLTATTWLNWAAIDESRTRMTQVAARRNRLGLIEVFGVDHLGKVWHRRQLDVNLRLHTDWTDFGGALRADVPVIPGAPLAPPRTVHLVQVETGRYLDAHEIAEKDYQVVTRPGGQTDTTQNWLLTDLGHGTCTLTQVSSGRNLHAYEDLNTGFRVVTRPPQSNSTQIWLVNLVGGTDVGTLRQTSTGQFLTASGDSADDYRAFTHGSINADQEQRWRIVPAG
jgi:hypothetical protein